MNQEDKITDTRIKSLDVWFKKREGYKEMCKVIMLLNQGMAGLLRNI